LRTSRLGAALEN